jgi:hypothetical protein
MRLTCSQCDEAFANEVPLTVIRDDYLYLFCHTRCRDKWFESKTVEIRLEDANEAFNPSQDIS